MSVKSVKGLKYITWDNSGTKEAEEHNRRNFPRAFIGSYAIIRKEKAGNKKKGGIRA